MVTNESDTEGDVPGDEEEIEDEHDAKLEDGDEKGEPAEVRDSST